MKKMVTLWKVTKAVWGSDSPIYMYFKTKAEADNYYHSTNYVDPPERIRVDAGTAEEALDYTNFILCLK
jgi:hypothetical protein